MTTTASGGGVGLTINDMPEEIREQIQFLREQFCNREPAWRALCDVMQFLSAISRGEPVAVADSMTEAWNDWYEQYGTDGNGHIARSVCDACHTAFTAAWPNGAEAASEAALDVLTGLNSDQRAAVKFYQQNPVAALQDMRNRFAHPNAARGVDEGMVGRACVAFLAATDHCQSMKDNPLFVRSMTAALTAALESKNV